MIISELQGGIGNQFFIYFFSKWFSEKLSKKILFKTNSYAAELSKKYSIKLEINRFFTYNEIEPFFGRIYWKLAKINKANYKTFPILCDENNLDSTNWENVPFIYLNGHWISRNYFNLYSDLISNIVLSINLGEFNQKLYERIITTNSISIHIRGKQYINLPSVMETYGTISKNYYIQSIKKIQEIVKNPTFFIFSNDIGYAKSLIEPADNIIFIDNEGPDIEHFYLMANCKHNIIINSTFSWWAAVLNKSINRTVICPTKWSGNIISNNDFEKLIFDDWIKINN